MNFEKLVHSKVNDVADWIIRIIVINMLIIVSSLAIVTIYPAVSAGYNLFNDYAMNRNPSLFKGYFAHLKQHIGRKIVLTFLVISFFVLGYLNIRYYSYQMIEQISTFDTIGYYITIGLLAIWYAITLYSIVVIRVYPELSFIRLFKLAFFLAGKYYFSTVLIVLVYTIPLWLLYFPQIFFIFVFAGISLPLILHVLLTKRAVIYIESLGDQNG